MSAYGMKKCRMICASFEMHMRFDFVNAVIFQFSFVSEPSNNHHLRLLCMINIAHETLRLQCMMAALWVDVIVDSSTCASL